MIVAVTGASGFIGQEVLCELRKNSDVKIVALSRQERAGDGDIIYRSTDYSVESLVRVINDVDVVIHLAAVRGTAGRYSDYSINETITENLLIAMGECKVNRIVFTSSIAVYSDTAKMPWKEDMMLTPKTLYGITKAACEHLCMYYSKKYGFEYEILRVAQVLGPGEKRRVMTNVFMEQAAEGRKLRVIGKSKAQRQYVYSRDLAKVLCTFVTAQCGSSIVNVGMDVPLTNLKIAELVNEVYKNRAGIDYDDSTEETIESSMMSTDHFKMLSAVSLLSFKEALIDISARQ